MVVLKRKKLVVLGSCFNLSSFMTLSDKLSGTYRLPCPMDMLTKYYLIVYVLPLCEGHRALQYSIGRHLLNSYSGL